MPTMKEEHRLPEGRVIIHRPDVAEIIVDEGVEINGEILQ